MAYKHTSAYINIRQHTFILHHIFIELDDGKILTGKPNQFDGKNLWVSGSDFPVKANPVRKQINGSFFRTFWKFYGSLYGSFLGSGSFLGKDAIPNFGEKL